MGAPAHTDSVKGAKLEGSVPFGRSFALAFARKVGQLFGFIDHRNEESAQCNAESTALAPSLANMEVSHAKPVVHSVSKKVSSVELLHGKRARKASRVVQEIELERKSDVPVPSAPAALTEKEAPFLNFDTSVGSGVSVSSRPSATGDGKRQCTVFIDGSSVFFPENAYAGSSFLAKGATLDEGKHLTATFGRLAKVLDGLGKDFVVKKVVIYFAVKRSPEDQETEKNRKPAAASEGDVFRAAAVQSKVRGKKNAQRKKEKALRKELLRNFGGDLKQMMKEQMLEALASVDACFKFDLVWCLDEDRFFLKDSSEIHFIISGDSDVGFNLFSGIASQRVVWLPLSAKEVSVIDARRLKSERMAELFPSVSELVGERHYLWSQRCDVVEKDPLERTCFLLSILVSCFWRCSDFGEQWKVLNEKGEERSLWLPKVCKWLNLFLKSLNDKSEVWKTWNLAAFYTWFRNQAKEKVRPTGLVKGLMVEERWDAVLECLARSGPKILCYGVGLSKEKEKEALEAWTKFTGKDSVDPTKFLAGLDYEVVDKEFRMPVFGSERISSRFNNFVQQRERKPDKDGDWQQPQRKFVVHQSMAKSPKQLVAPLEEGNSYAVLAAKRKEEQKEKKEEQKKEKEETKDEKKIKKSKKTLRLDSNPRMQPGRATVSNKKAESDPVSNKNKGEDETSSKLVTKQAGTLSYFLSVETASCVRDFVDGLDRLVDLVLFPFGMTIALVAGVPTKAVVYDALMSCLGEFVGADLKQFPSKRIQGNESGTSFYGSEECVGGVMCTIPVAFDLFKRLLTEFLESVKASDLLWSAVTLPLLQQLSNGAYRCVRYNLANRIASAFGNLITEQMQLLAHAFVRQACALQGVEVTTAKIQKATGVKGFRSEETEKERKAQGAPKELADEKHDLSTQEEAAVLERFGSFVRQQFVKSGCVEANVNGGVAADSIERFFNFARSNEAQYLSSLKCIKLLEGLWRKVVAPFYKGVLPVPRKRRKWKFQLDNGSCKAISQWKLQNECSDWSGFFEQYKKKSRKSPPFASFTGHSPTQANVKGCVGIITDGHSLHLYGWKLSDKCQRTAGRTIADMTQNNDAVFEMLEGPNCDFDDAYSDGGVDFGGGAEPIMKKVKTTAGRGFTGICSIEKARKTGVVKEGFFKDRITLCLDYGGKNSAAGGFFLNDCLHGFLRVTSTDFYRQTGRDAVGLKGSSARKKLEAEHAENEDFGARNVWEKSMRQSDSDHVVEGSFMGASRGFLSEYDLYLEEQQMLTAKERSAIWAQEQKYLFGIKASIDDQYADIVRGNNNQVSKSLVIVVGRGGKGGSKGSRGNASLILEKFLAQFYLVLTIDEFNTSKLCPQCHIETEFFCEKQEIRTKKCTHCRTKWTDQATGEEKGLDYWAYDRDFGASANFFYLAKCFANTGLRPLPFLPSKEREKLLKFLSDEEKATYGKVYGGQESPQCKKH